VTDFNPERWLVVVEHCCQNAVGAEREAYLRTALNRAYYAALLTTRRRIDPAFGINAVPRARTHYAILEAVRSGGPRFEHIHQILQRLKRLRETADYEMG
jgi:hypothetical protein